jgi:hypothetical protein
VGITAIYRWDKQRIGVRFPADFRDIFLLHVIPFGFEAHPVFYPMGLMCCFLWGKAAGSVKLTSHLHQVQRLRILELYFHCPVLQCVLFNELGERITTPFFVFWNLFENILTKNRNYAILSI